MSEWTPEDAEAESVEVFGAPIPDDEKVSLCDDCYTALMNWAGELELAQERERLASISHDNEANRV